MQRWFLVFGVNWTIFLCCIRAAAVAASKVAPEDMAAIVDGTVLGEPLAVDHDVLPDLEEMRRNPP